MVRRSRLHSFSRSIDHGTWNFHSHEDPEKRGECHALQKCPRFILSDLRTSSHCPQTKTPGHSQYCTVVGWLFPFSTERRFHGPYLHNQSQLPVSVRWVPMPWFFCLPGLFLTRAYWCPFISRNSTLLLGNAGLQSCVLCSDWEWTDRMNYGGKDLQALSCRTGSWW